MCHKQKIGTEGETVKLMGHRVAEAPKRRLTLQHYSYGNVALEISSRLITLAQQSIRLIADKEKGIPDHTKHQQAPSTHCPLQVRATYFVYIYIYI